MNPTTTKAKDGTPLDASVVALARSIRDIESGSKYDARGKSAEYGAYQYTEPTWKSDAQRYLGDSNADITNPQNQDKVMYYKILDQKKNGYTPEQVASEHNSGKRDAYLQGHRGVNKYGVAYDTPAYVGKVLSNYNKYKSEYISQHGQQPRSQTIQSQQGSSLNQADQQSAEQYGAIFPAKEGDSGLASGLKAVGNLPSSLVHMGKGIGNSILHPIETIKGIGGLIGEPIGTLAGFALIKAREATGNIPKGSSDLYDLSSPKIEALEGYLKNRYGSLENLKRSATNDPIGFGSDVVSAVKLGTKIADTTRNFVSPNNIANSQALDVQGSIKSGDINRGDIYKGDTNILKPEFAQGRIDDIAQKLDLVKPGLGDQFRKGVDINNITMKGNVPELLVKQADALINKYAPLSNQATNLYGNYVNEGISKVGQAGLYPIKAVGRGIKNLTTQGLGVTTGEGAKTIDTALSSAIKKGDVREAFKESLRGNTSPDEIIGEAKKGLQSIKNQRSETYRQQLASISDDTRTYDISPLEKSLNEQLKAYNIRPTSDGQLDFSRSSIANSGAARSDIQGVYDTLKTWGLKPGDRTAVGLDTLKQQLGDFYSDSNQAKSFVQGVKSTLWNPGAPDQSILGKVPGYDSLTGNYSESSKLIKDIQSSLSLGGKAGVETTFKKLTSALRGNNQIRADLVQELNNKTGGTLIPKLAGSDMSQILPSGLVGTAEKIGGVAAIFTGQGLAALLPLITVASPRIVGEFILALGLTASQANSLFSNLGIPNAAIFVSRALSAAKDSGISQQE